MARVFLAIPLPERLKTRLGEEIDRLRLSGAQINWTPPENLHVTLAFLGEQDDAAVLDLDRLVKGITAETPPLALLACGLGGFPDLERPRVIWCGVQGQEEDHDEELHRLRNALGQALRKGGFRREKGEFHPHITLGRVRSPANLRELVARMGPAAKRPFGAFELKEVVLFESHLGPRGSSYTPLQSFPLGR